MNTSFLSSAVLPWLWAACAWAVVVIVLLHLRRLAHQRDRLQREKDAVYNFVHDVSEAFSGPGETRVDFLLKRTLFYAQQAARAGAGAVYFIADDAWTLTARAIAGMFPPLVHGWEGAPEDATDLFQRLHERVRAQTVRRGEGLIGVVAETGLPLLIEDAERDPRLPRFVPEALRVRSLLLLPMRFHQSVMGVLALVNRIDETPFIQADLNLLQGLADQASVTLYYARFNEELEKKKTLDDDLQVARRVQNALLPKRIPTLPGLELAAFSVPAREIGGDYYDFTFIDETHVGVAVADVSGKGITGAMFMGLCRSALHTHAPGRLSPAAVLKAINRTLAGDIQEDMFISMLYAILDTRTFDLTLARAGHTKPLIVSAGGAVAPHDARGIALGMADPDTFDTRLEESRLTLRPGDTWIAYTDGVLEALNDRQEEWGLTRLRSVVREETAAGAQAIVDRVRQELLAFVGDVAQYDDMTLVVMQRKGG